MVFWIGDELFVMYDLCMYGYVWLFEGYVEDGCVECLLY